MCYFMYVFFVILCLSVVLIKYWFDWLIDNCAKHLAFYVIVHFCERARRTQYAFYRDVWQSNARHFQHRLRSSMGCVWLGQTIVIFSVLFIPKYWLKLYLLTLAFVNLSSELFYAIKLGIFDGLETAVMPVMQQEVVAVKKSVGAHKIIGHAQFSSCG